MIRKTITLAVALTLFSCASRKSQTDKTDVKEVAKVEQTSKEVAVEEKKIDTNIKKDVSIEIDNKKNVVTEIEMITAVDPTKKSNYKGREFQNAKIENRKIIDLSNENLKYKLSYYEITKEMVNVKKERDLYIKMYNEYKAKVKAKEVEVDNSSIYLYFFLLILIVLAFIYIQYKLSNKINKSVVL